MQKVIGTILKNTAKSDLPEILLELLECKSFKMEEIKLFLGQMDQLDFVRTCRILSETQSTEMLLSLALDRLSPNGK